MNKEGDSRATFIGVGVAVLIAIVGIGAVVYALTLPEAPKPAAETTHDYASHEHTELSAPPASNVEAAILIAYSNDGFAAPMYEVKAGETVRVENNSDEKMYFAAGEHEHHDVSSPVNLGIIEPGKASSFVAPGAGMYLFHNHDNDEYKGTLVVR